MEEKLKLNTVLLTKDGRYFGNCIINKVTEVEGKETIYDFISDYGNRVYGWPIYMIEMYFNIGKVADSTHKNYTKASEPEKTSNKIENKGSRFNTGKTQWGLVDFAALEGMVKVLEFGAQKYGIGNWQKGLTTVSIIESLLRHIFAYLKGEDIDSETGLKHVDHALCNAMFLVYMEKNKKEMDNRKEYNNEISR